LEGVDGGGFRREVGDVGYFWGVVMLQWEM
jgi:hypothetical protein